MKKSAFLPVDRLPLIQELLDHFELVAADCMAMEEQFGDNQKVRVALGKRVTTNPELLSYYGTMRGGALKINPVVLSPVEFDTVFGTTRVQIEAKYRLLQQRLDSTEFLKTWLKKYDEHVLHLGTFTAYPGSKIMPHFGIANSYIRIHLPIQLNPACVFHTEFDDPRTWEHRTPFGFLDFHVKHWVTFDAPAESGKRVVLYLDLANVYYDMYYPGVRRAQILANKDPLVPHSASTATDSEAPMAPPESHKEP